MTVFADKPYLIAYYGIPLTIPKCYRYISLDDSGNIRLHKSKPVESQHRFIADGDDHLLAGFRANPSTYEFHQSLVELDDHLSKLFYLNLAVNRGAPKEHIVAQAASKLSVLSIDDYYYLKRHWIGELSDETDTWLRLLAGIEENRRIVRTIEVPHWSRYIATNKNGDIWVYSEEPKLYEDDGVWLPDNENAHAKKVSYVADHAGWTASLSEIPLTLRLQRSDI